MANTNGKLDLGGILKNIIVFLTIFLVVNFVMNLFIDSPQEIEAKTDTIVFETTKQEYSRLKPITVKIENYTENAIKIKNDCPSEPLSVYKKEKNDWIQKTASPKVECTDTSDITIEAGEKTTIAYNSWNHALFSEMGTFKIKFDTEIDGEIKTIESNEFLVEKEGIISQLWYGILYRPIYNILIFLISFLPKHSLGWAIIILTLIIRTILLAPSQKAIKAQKNMQEIQPKLEKIKKKYKGDQQKIATETMAVWKEAKANPLSGCLPVLLQFPFLIAVFYVVKNGINPDNTFMLYSEYSNFALSDINTAFFGLELRQPNVYVLPLIVGSLQFIQMQMTLTKSKKQKKKSETKKTKKGEKGQDVQMATNMMSYIMPVMIAVFTAGMPSGVGIYWGTSTTYGIIQQMIIAKSSKKEKSSSEVTVKVIEKKD